MDAPAPDNIAAEEGGQQQTHQEEKEHKPMLRRVKDKMKKIKNTIAGHGHDHEQDTGDSNSADEDEEDAAMREAEVEKGGYQQQDVEDKPIFADSSPKLHGGAPMYDSERIPAAAKEVKHNDAPGVRLGDLGAPAAAQEVKRDDAAGMRLGDFGGPASAKEVKRDDAPGVRLGDLGSPVVEDPAAPNWRTPMPRGGEDIGTTDAVRNFEAMTVSDDPKQVGARKMDVDVSKEYEAMPVSDGTGEEWNDAPTDADVVAGVGTVVASKAQQVTPGFGAGGNAQDDSSATAAPESVTTGAGKRDLDLPQEGTRAPYTGTEGLKNAATGATGTEELKNEATDATTEGTPGATYTDMIKSAAAGTTEYGKKLASTMYEKVAGVGTAVTSLTGGNRVSESVQPTTEGNTGEGVAAEGPVLHGAAPRTNTNVM